MAPALHQGQTAQRLELQTTGAGKHRSNGPQTDDALTIKVDHPLGAHHAANLSVATQNGAEQPCVAPCIKRALFFVLTHHADCMHGIIVIKREIVECCWSRKTMPGSKHCCHGTWFWRSIASLRRRHDVKPKHRLTQCLRLFASLRISDTM